MKWMEVTIFTTEEGLDPVCARLDMLGINQVMIEQGRESIEQFLRDTAKYWDYADMDRLVTSDEPCVKAYIADVADNRATVRAIEDSFAVFHHRKVTPRRAGVQFMPLQKGDCQPGPRGERC